MIRILICRAYFEWNYYYLRKCNLRVICLLSLPLPLFGLVVGMRLQCLKRTECTIQ